MKKFTSLLALFLVCFGITASAQTIETIGENITDPETQLTNGSYVIFKNVSTQKFVYVDYAAGNEVKMGVDATVGAGTEYLWQVHTDKGQYYFTCTSGNFFPRPKTLAETKNGVNYAGPSAAYKGTFVIAKHTTTNFWTFQDEWVEKKNGKKINHNKFWSVDGDKFAGIDIAHKDEVSTQYEVIPVTIAKTDDQIALDEILNTWKGLEKYAGGISDADMKKLEKCTTKAEAEEIVNQAVKNPIDATEYFQILNVKSGKALNVTDGSLSEVDASIFDASQLWKLTQSAEGKYTFLQANHNQFVQVPGNNTLGAAEVVLDVTSLDLAQWSLSAEGKYLSVNAEGQFVAAADAAAEGAQWYLLPKKDLRIMLNPVYGADGTTVVEGWASVYLPFNATCGNSAANIEYYGVNEVGNDVAKLQLTDGIQAGKGIILHHVGEQVDFGFKIGKNAKNTEDQTWNLLLGTNVNLPKTAASLVLGQNAEGVVGLYAPAAENLLANKAYLEVPAAAANGLKFVFDDEITGIEGVETVTPADNIYYDLSGRRVAQPTKGIYVVNGQKVLVK